MFCDVKVKFLCDWQLPHLAQLLIAEQIILRISQPSISDRTVIAYKGDEYTYSVAQFI